MPADWPAAGVSLPAEVQQALVDDKLVFFCGAGVSIPPPSSLPSFIGLARDIAIAVDPSFDPKSINRTTQLDVLLGRLDEQKGNVHLRVQHLLEKSTDANSLHRNLLSLFHGHTVRIVTTNFDQHFERVNRDSMTQMPVYAAPALPRGDDFHGLVHLHGRVPLLSDERLVLTDRDFGRAYITEGWATEFLTKLFTDYTVVFLGYSAQDTVMRYLARALPTRYEQRQLYAFTPSRSAATWDSLPVTPILYPQPGGDDDHDALATFMEAWAQQANALAQDNFDYVQRLHEEGPEHTVLSAGQIEWILADSEHLPMFRTFTPTVEWCNWLESNKHLDRLFDTQLQGSSADADWAEWLCRTIAIDGGRVLVDLLAKHRGQMSHTLWLHACLALNNHYASGVPGQQLAVMLADATSVSEPDRLAMLTSTIAKSDPAVAEVLFRRLQTLQNAFQLAWVWQSDGAAQMEISSNSSEYSLREIWTVLAPQLAGPELMTEYLIGVLSAAEAEGAIFAGRATHDGLSTRRGSIGDTGRMSSGTNIDLLVEILVELLSTETAARDPLRALELLSRRSEIVKRISVYALANARSENHVDRVLDALVEGGLIFAYRFKPEVFATLAKTFGQASARARQDICDYVENYEPAAPEREIASRQRYDVFEWLSRSWPADAILGSALKRLSDQHPEFRPNDHVDQNYWSHFGTPDPLPGATGKFRGLTHQSVAAMLATDGSLDDVLDSQETLAELDDYLERIRSRARFLHALADRGIWAAPVWNSVLHKEATSGKAIDFAALAPLLLRHPHIASLSSELRWLLTPTGASLDSETDEGLRNRKQLAFDIWRRLSEAVESYDDPPTVQWAVGSPVGEMASVYLELFTRIKLRRGRKTLLVGERHELDAMVRSSANVSDPTALILIRYARNLCYFDTRWFDEMLLPAFDWTHIAAPRAWEGLIATHGWSDALIERLRDKFKSALTWVHQNLPASTDNFLTVHSSLYFRSTGSPDPTWADGLLMQGSEAERGRWVRALGAHVQQFPESNHVADLLRYWDHRISTRLPLAISKLEQVALIAWLRTPDIDFDAAVDLFIKGPLISNQESASHFFLDLRGLPLASYPISCARFMLHITNGSPGLPQDVRVIAEHAVSLVSPTNPALAIEMLNSLLIRGFTPARRMLDDVRDINASSQPIAPL